MLDDDEYEDDPAKVMFALRGLPKFPDPVDEISNVAEPGYLTASGPTCLIREVLIPPAIHKLCPEAIFDILEESRILQNAGQYESALKKTTQAWKLWKKKNTWEYLHNGLDPVLEEAKRKKAREQELKDLEEMEGDIGNQLDAVNKAIAAAQAEAGPPKSGDSNDPPPPPEDGQEVEESEDEKKRKSLIAEKQEREKAVRAARDRMRQEDEEREERIPNVGDAVETEFELFIWNAMGSVYQSMGNDLKALSYYWRAKMAHDDYINVSEKKQTESKKAEKKEVAKKADDGLSDLKDLIAKPKKAEAKAGDAEESEDEVYHEDNPALRLSTDQLRNMKLEAILPFDYCSPATALTYSNLGAACYHLKRYDIAMNCYWSTQQIRFQCIPESSGEFVDIGSTLNNIGVCLHQLKRYKEAFSYFQSAEELFLQRLHPIHPRVNTVRNNLDRLKPLRKQLDCGEMKVKNSVVKVDPLVLRKWRVEMTDFMKMIAEFAPAKKAKKKGGKKKKK